MATANERILDAARAGHLNGVTEALSNGANIETRTDGLLESNQTALIIAADYGREDVVQHILSLGADMEAQDRDGYTPLMCAAFNGHDHVMKILITKRANLNTQNTDGYTALMCAAFNGHDHVINSLLTKSAAVNTQNIDGETALMIAARYGYKRAVDLLISHSANISIKNKKGETALHLARKREYPRHGRDYPATIRALSNHPTAPLPGHGKQNSSKPILASPLQSYQQASGYDTRLQFDLQRQCDTIGRLQADLQKERDSVGRLQADLQRERDTVGRLQADIQTERDTIALFQSELQEKDHLLRYQHGQTQQKLGQLEADNRRLVAQVQDLQNRLTQATAEVNLFRFTRIQIPCQDQDFWKVPRCEVNIETKLGEGTWGSVHKGMFRGQQVAVKLIHKEILQEYTIDKMKREIRVMSHIQHPNLVRLVAAVVDHEVEQCSNSPLLLLELLHSNLRTAYSERDLTRNVLVSIFRDVAYGLHYLHEHQEPIIHRDVSATNVLLEEMHSGGWRGKLSDFGSANIARECKTAAPGALVYSPPETYPPENPFEPLPKQTTKIDVFSYGYVLAEVIAKEMPAPEKRMGILISIQQRWRCMYGLITACIRSKPDDRWTMTQVLQTLNSLPPQ